jgi:hypothetical protein
VGHILEEEEMKEVVIRTIICIMIMTDKYIMNGGLIAAVICVQLIEGRSKRFDEVEHMRIII